MDDLNDFALNEEYKRLQSVGDRLALYIAKDNSGKATLYVQDLQAGTITSLDLTCEDVCVAVMGIGCPVGSAIACAAACYGTAGFGYPTLCALVYYAICRLATGRCDEICDYI